ncbi:DUF305 domain-containing protein [Qipengyuania mesophila]|uniref:DUF305 domain-containing protein n=1 Tax=Qipengyuania mesophila TaxID=2867246 RepID=UPI003517B365
MDSAHSRGGHGKWTTFFAMIATSVVTMFVLTYFNSWAIDHDFFSQTRMWMALMMGCAMIVVMLGFMWGMYRSRTTKLLVFAAAFAFGGLFLWLVRSQQTVDDEAWMKAMIPHHSIAVLTSKRAQISDPRVRKLADDIIKAQIKEIAEMKLLLADIEANGEMGSGEPIVGRSTKLTPDLEAKAKEAIGRDITAEGESDLAPMR